MSLQRSGHEQRALSGPPAPGLVGNLRSRLLPPERFAGTEKRLQFWYTNRSFIASPNLNDELSNKPDQYVDDCLVISRQGKSVRSKPYNFRAFNGCYVLLETDYTCFVNPWTKKLEFVAGHHRVLKGPSNPDVFAYPPEGATAPTATTNDSIDADTIKELQAEICTILTGKYSMNPTQSADRNSSHWNDDQRNLEKKNVTGTPKRPAGLHTRNRLDKTDHALLETKTRRRKDLATLMGSLIDEVVKVRGSNSYDSCCSSPYSKPHR